MKKNLIALTCVLVFAAGLAGRALAQDSGLPSLIVAPFSGDVTHIQYWQPAMGEGLSEMLITELGKLNKFQVLETTQLGALKDEIKMGQDGWVEQSEKVEKGGFAGWYGFVSGEEVQRQMAQPQLGQEVKRILENLMGKYMR